MTLGVPAFALISREPILGSFAQLEIRSPRGTVTLLKPLAVVLTG